MTSHEPDTSANFFEAMYRDESDPWNFEHSLQEQARYDAMERSLGNRRFRCAYEPACSVGVFTQRLAAHCDRVIACDFAPSAVSLARQRCAHLNHVSIACAELPHHIVAEAYDLLVFAELGYYFTQTALRELWAALCLRLEPEGLALSCHWLGSSRDHRLSGQQVQEVLSSCRQLELGVQWRHDEMHLLAVWRKNALA